MFGDVAMCRDMMDIPAATMRLTELRHELDDARKKLADVEQKFERELATAAPRRFEVINGGRCDTAPRRRGDGRPRSLWLLATVVLVVGILPAPQSIDDVGGGLGDVGIERRHVA